MTDCAEMIGKKIKKVYVDGFGIDITFDDDTVFSYFASDGGYSTWDFFTKEYIEESIEEIGGAHYFFDSVDEDSTFN